MDYQRAMIAGQIDKTTISETAHRLKCLIALLESIRVINPYAPLMPGRHGQEAGADYRYGFQGQEMDDEIKGEGNSLNYTFRMHDPRVGRFFAIDPLAEKYPHYTPYAFSGNRVIDANKLEGAEPQVHNSIETEIPFSKGIMQYDFAVRLNIVPSSNMIAVSNYKCGMYTIAPMYHARTGELMGYLASVPGMINDYVDSDRGRVILYDQIRIDWIIAPDHIKEFSRNVNIYAKLSAMMHNYGRDFRLSESTMQFMEGDYLGALGTQWKGALKNPFYWIQVGGGILVANGGGGRVQSIPEVHARSYRLITMQIPASTYGNIRGKFSSGNWKMYNNVKFQGKFDYIINSQGEVIIGSKHSYLSGGEPVGAAGTLKIRNGKIVAFDNASGHYVPTLEQAARFRAMFEEAGIDMSKAKQITYSEKGKVIDKD